MSHGLLTKAHSCLSFLSILVMMLMSSSKLIWPLLSNQSEWSKFMMSLVTQIKHRKQRYDINSKSISGSSWSYHKLYSVTTRTNLFEWDTLSCSWMMYHDVIMTKIWIKSQTHFLTLSELVHACKASKSYVMKVSRCDYTCTFLG